MKKRSLVFLPLVLVAGLLLSSSSVIAFPSRRHPRLERAQVRLTEAKNLLERAPHAFGGHRAQAIQDVNQALEELRQALAYGRNH